MCTLDYEKNWGLASWAWKKMATITRYFCTSPTVRAGPFSCGMRDPSCGLCRRRRRRSRPDCLGSVQRHRFVQRFSHAKRIHDERFFLQTSTLARALRSMLCAPSYDALRLPRSMTDMLIWTRDEFAPQLRAAQPQPQSHIKRIRMYTFLQGLCHRRSARTVSSD